LKKIFILAVVFTAFIGCKKNEEKNAKYTELSKANWLIGNWENELEGGTMTESWEKANDSTFKGASYFMKNKMKDTIHLESVELTERNGLVSYNPTVQGQNNDLPVVFKLTSATAKQLVFENPAHDYPQKITYTQITADSLVAEISGMQQGKPASEKYPMKKK
jgi:hypothetical protein